MKRIILLVLCLVMVFSVAASCAPAQKTLMDQIKASGKLKMGCSPDYPPYEFPVKKDGNLEIVGLDVLMAQEICKDLGVELEIVQMDFDSILMALDNGSVDIGISGFNPNPERRKTVDFSSIYWEARYGFLVHSGDENKIVDEVALKGLRIGVQKGTTMEATANENFTESTISSLVSVPNLVMDLKAGNLDAILLDLPVAEANANADTALRVAQFIIPDAEGGNAIAFRKGNQDFVDAVDATLNRLISSGKMNEFYLQAIADAENAEE